MDNIDAQRFLELLGSMDVSSNLLLGEPVDGIYPASLVFEGDSPSAFREMLTLLGDGIYLLDAGKWQVKAQAVVKVNDQIITAGEGAVFGLKMGLDDDGNMFGKVVSAFDILRDLRSEV